MLCAQNVMKGGHAPVLDLPSHYDGHLIHSLRFEMGPEK